MKIHYFLRMMNNLYLICLVTTEKVNRMNKYSLLRHTVMLYCLKQLLLYENTALTPKAALSAFAYSHQYQLDLTITDSLKNCLHIMKLLHLLNWMVAEVYKRNENWFWYAIPIKMIEKYEVKLFCIVFCSFEFLFGGTCLHLHLYLSFLSILMKI